MVLAAVCWLLWLECNNQVFSDYAELLFKVYNCVNDKLILVEGGSLAKGLG